MRDRGRDWEGIREEPTAEIQNEYIAVYKKIEKKYIYFL